MKIKQRPPITIRPFLFGREEVFDKNQFRKNARQHFIAAHVRLTKSGKSKLYRAVKIT